jgi:hypothetical protein
LSSGMKLASQSSRDRWDVGHRYTTARDRVSTGEQSAARRCVKGIVMVRS